MSTLSDSSREEISITRPKVIIEVSINVVSNVANEVGHLLNACKGENRDPWEHQKYWKCMLELIAIILEKDVTTGDINALIKEKVLPYSRRQIVRSLRRFVDNKILNYVRAGSYSVWKLNKEELPTLYLFRGEKKLSHIVTHFLTLDAIKIEKKDT